MFRQIMVVESRLSVMPPCLKLSKKPGPTCKPIMKTNSISPNSCMKVKIGVGAVKPKCPAAMPANNTNVTPREMLPTLILPRYTPVAMTTAYSTTICATESVVVNKFINQSISSIFRAAKVAKTFLI